MGTLNDYLAYRPDGGLLRGTLAYIEEHPEEWRQDRWRCGTAACYAGHAAKLAGAVFSAWDDSLVVISAADMDRFTARKQMVGPAVGLTAGAHMQVGEYAQMQLGLDRYRAETLFASGNDLERLRRLVDIYATDADRAAPAAAQ